MIFWWARRGAWAWLGILLTALGAYALWSSQAGRLPEDSLIRYLPQADVRLEGVLKFWPAPNAFNTGWQAQMACTHLINAQGRHAVSGSIQIHVPGLCPAWSAGDTLSLRGALSAFAEPGNPGEFNYAEFERLQGVVGQCRARQRSEVVRLSCAASLSLGAVAAACHRHWVEAIRQNVPEPAQALVVALVLGDRGGLPPALQESMAATGMAHILAVSGMNIGLVLASLLGLGKLCRLPRAFTWLLGLVGVALFTAMAGGSPSVLRAALMAGILIFTLWRERPGDGLSVLSLTALVLLIWDPHGGAQPGFQLSFTATAGLLIVSPLLPKPKQGWKKWGSAIVDTMGLTGAAMLGTLPLQWLYFYSLTPVGMLTNLAVLPLVTVATDGGLLLGLMAGSCPAWTVHGVGWLTGWAGQGIVAVARLAQPLPWGRIFIGSADPFWAAGVYMAAALALWKKTRPLGLIGLVLLAALVPGFRQAPPGPGETRFTFLDLGVGESTLIETGDGRRVLVDTGTAGEFLWRVKPFLASCGINRLDALMVSHPDADHAGGTGVCLAYFKPAQIIFAGFTDAKSREFADTLQVFSACAHRVYRGDAVRLGPDLSARMLWPPRFEVQQLQPVRKAGQRRGPEAKTHASLFSTRSQSNEHSLIFVGNFPGGNALFTGDATAADEYWGTENLSFRLLKVAHHGSQSSSSEAFLARAAPELAVVQSGFFGQHHFPHPATWARLQRYAGQSLDTSRTGAVQVTFSRQGKMRWQGWK
ncbi:MAG: DNA internalization-related competence protein ComEC/Rec2, partial [Candidatus Firestonebacteria bacterium]|nr:DNA internalization-related competence protein ComEC/Rec2 [Candidatus Firestonebacteria bacterium]